MIPVLILAGGKGTRLGSIAADIPKPMVEVLGRPLLEWQFELAYLHGAPSITVFAGHKADVIVDRYHNKCWNGIPLDVIVESEALGTAGAVLSEFDRLPEEFFILYGDTMTNVDLSRMLTKHRESCVDASIYVHPNDHPHDSDLVEVSSDGYVKAIHGYPHPAGTWKRNLVNAALYIFKKRALLPWSHEKVKRDFAKHLIPSMLEIGIRVFAYRGYDYIKDMGTPDRLKKVENDVQAGLLDFKLSSKPRPSVFLDRDGTIIEEVNHLNKPDQVKLLTGVSTAIRNLNRSSVPVIVVTNQPVVARGEVSLPTLDEIHGRIDALLGEDGAFVDAWHYCPHHPDKGYDGEIPDLKITCDCRKPATGMIEEATKIAPVLTEESWIIGDTSTDLMTGKLAGLRTVLLRTGYAGCDSKYAIRPDYTFSTLADAVDFILKRFPLLRVIANTITMELQKPRLIAISGYAHSGKSTLASMISEIYCRQNKKCHVISLDGYIISNNLRGNTFESRHDLLAVSSLVEVLIRDRQESIVCEIPHYNRLTRSPHPNKEHVVIEPNDIVVLEGVSAVSIPDLVSGFVPFLWVEVEENIRRERFLCDYEWRGFSTVQALELWDKRIKDEVIAPPHNALVVNMSPNPFIK